MRHLVFMINEIIEGFNIRCGHPHDDPGSHPSPPVANNLILQEEPPQGWKIEFDETVR